MKKDSIKNVAHLFWSKYSFIMIASLSLLCLTSCEKENKEGDAVIIEDLSKIVVGNIYCEFPQRYVPEPNNRYDFSYFVSQFVNTDLNIQLYSFPLYVKDAHFTTATVTDTVIGDTIKIKICPDESISIDDPIGTTLVSMNFFCTIYNVPKNKVFYVKFEERTYSLTKMFYRE